MGVRRRLVSLLVITCLGLAGCDQKDVGEGIAVSSVLGRTKERQGSENAALEAWAWQQLGPFDWGEYRYGKPTQIEDVVLKAMVQGERYDEYEVSFITVRPATPHPDGQVPWQVLYPHQTGAQDQVRLVETYWMRFDQESLQLERLSSETPTYRRLPYNEQETLTDELKIGFLELLRATPDFFEAYESGLGQSEDEALRLLQSQVDEACFYLPKGELARRYPVRMSPYVLGNQLTLHEEAIVYEISSYATEKQPKYHIRVPVSLLLNHYKKVYYRYNYIVGTENGRIEWIRLESVVPEKPID